MHSGLTVGDLTPKALIHQSTDPHPSHCTWASSGGLSPRKGPPCWDQARGRAATCAGGVRSVCPRPPNRPDCQEPLGAGAGGGGVCCVIQARFCQGCLESRPAWKSRARGPGRAPPPRRLTETSVEGQTHETPQAGMSSAWPLHPQPQPWVRDELGPASYPSLCTGASTRPGQPHPWCPPGTPGGPHSSTAPSATPGAGEHTCVGPSPPSRGAREGQAGGRAALSLLPV